ncbi:uncharacterized protein PG986_011304 [Apiospora aurea]|uniref:Antifungal protein n=1 Tax=Apiospora aurea TaxID=335848 RepID=A0ABR1Q4N9_9PEZI
MQFFKLALAVIASSSAVSAMPTSGTNDAHAVEKRADEGVCNGTSCWFRFQNIKCSKGTSTKQSGAGNGEYCQIHHFGHGKAYAVCPGKAG